MVELSDTRKAELRKLANKSPIAAVILGLFLPPISYVYIGKYRLAVLNLVTLNYLMLGVVIVPIQTRNAIINARRELKAIGIPKP